jgi:adenylate cyclase
LTSILPAEARIAARFLEDAIELDPNYALAHAHLAHCHEILFTHDGMVGANKTAALRHARVVVASGTDDATALAIAAFVIIVLNKDHETAFAAVERALSLNPSCATALYFAALMYGSPDARPMRSRTPVARCD